MSRALTEIVKSRDFWSVCRQRFPTEHDWLVSLVRAFRDGRADFVIIDSRRQKLQIEAATLAESLGLLSCTEQDDGQCTAWKYRLTDLGKTVIMDAGAPATYLT